MNRTVSERAIILAPQGRDATIAAAMLGEAGIISEIAENIDALVTLLYLGAGFAVITEEAIQGRDLRQIADFLQDQADWSDFPFILLTLHGGTLERNPLAGRYLKLLGNVTFLERPFHPTTLVSVANSALRGRLRQYDARSRLQIIRDAEEQLRIALAAGKLGAWTLDVDTMSLKASNDCKAHYGRRPSDLFCYDDLLACIHIDDRQRMENCVKEAFSNGSDYDIEYRCLWPDGATHWVQVRGRPELDAMGKAQRMVGVSQDISERKASEETLRNFASELERQVEMRTREREAISAQLHEAQKIETIGQLTGGVAHDFNNLLTPIVGGLEIVRGKTTDERSVRLLDGALQAAERARILVSRLLAFARRQNLETRPVDVANLLNDMAELIRRSIGPTIHLDMRVADNLPAAMVDPNQLELALLNLSVNARDAMPGGGTLRIEADEAEPENSSSFSSGPPLSSGWYVRIRVADTGLGMDAATLARAIEPFYSTKGIGKGTGLGLSMVHGLAAQSGGKLSLESRMGEGTMAELLIPAAAHEAIRHDAAPSFPALDTRILSILLVDDEELVRRGAAEMLRELGHEVAQADSGANALGLARSQAFDLMVTDYLMPGMSGLETIAEVRKVQANLPALMITGYADMTGGKDPDVPRLPKPFRLADLARAISELPSG